MLGISFVCSVGCCCHANPVMLFVSCTFQSGVSLWSLQSVVFCQFVCCEAYQLLLSPIRTMFLLDVRQSFTSGCHKTLLHKNNNHHGGVRYAVMCCVRNICCMRIWGCFCVRVIGVLPQQSPQLSLCCCTQRVFHTELRRAVTRHTK